MAAFLFLFFFSIYPIFLFTLFFTFYSNLSFALFPLFSIISSCLFFISLSLIYFLLLIFIFLSFPSFSIISSCLLFFPLFIILFFHNSFGNFLLLFLFINYQRLTCAHFFSPFNQTILFIPEPFTFLTLAESLNQTLDPP